MTPADAARVLRRADEDLRIQALDLILHAKRALARGEAPEGVLAHALAALGDAAEILRRGTVSLAAQPPRPPEVSP